MKIKFCGAATSVTGSCHLITTDKHKILLDCGLFQGSKALDELNFEPFLFTPSEIECVVLSHAHIDHCGRLPLLYKRGFTGNIYCTDATADLLDVMLKDSAHIQEQEAEWKNRKGERAGRAPVEPLYTTEDAIDVLGHVAPVLYDQLVDINDQMKIVFNDAGHILGSAITELWTEEGDRTSKLVFTGDLGMQDRPILRDPVSIKKADYLVMETTYGNRLHEENSTSIKRLMDIILETTDRGGNVVIPSFAVGRTQELIYELNRIYEGDSSYRSTLEKVHVYVDSPMAIAATEVFKKNAQVFDEETRNYILSGDHPLDFPNLHFTQTSDESRMINIDQNPKVIISASGMCDAGRIRHHLKHNLWNPKASIVFVGYQAEGTLGRSLLDGAGEVTLFGETIRVKAQIHNLEGFSGHADKNALMAWLRGFENKPHDIFLVHGEHDAKVDFAASMKEEIGWDCIAVDGYNEYQLSEITSLMSSHAEKEFVGDEQVQEVRTRIAQMHDALETVLYSTSLAMQNDLTPERMVEIKNTVAELEKGVLNLGSTVTQEERTGEYELPLEGELPPEEPKKGKPRKKNNGKKK
ncbi:MAG TPA: MBL fold metallo-hydrolase [Anaerovoracaceae bacterium]|nr:MBL fold metallo-hydrolase [Anaerovoracaceae bacterium]